MPSLLVIALRSGATAEEHRLISQYESKRPTGKSGVIQARDTLSARTQILKVLPDSRLKALFLTQSTTSAELQVDPRRTLRLKSSRLPDQLLLKVVQKALNITVLVLSMNCVRRLLHVRSLLRTASSTHRRSRLPQHGEPKTE